MRSYIIIDVICGCFRKYDFREWKMRRQSCKWRFSSRVSQRPCDTSWSLFFHYRTKLMFSRVCIYCLSHFQFVCLFCTILGCDPLPAKQPVNSTFCILKHWERSASCVCLSHQKPSSCISGTDKLWQELKFGWTTIKVFHLVWEKKCARMLTSWIFCVFIWLYWLDLKIRQLGWLDFLESLGAPVFSTYLLGFLPGAEDSSHKPKTSCWFLKAAKLVFLFSKANTRYVWTGDMYVQDAPVYHVV